MEKFCFICYGFIIKCFLIKLRLLKEVDLINFFCFFIGYFFILVILIFNLNNCKGEIIFGVLFIILVVFLFLGKVMIL